MFVPSSGDYPAPLRERSADYFHSAVAAASATPHSCGCRPAAPDPAAVAAEFAAAALPADSALAHPCCSRAASLELAAAELWRCASAAVPEPSSSGLQALPVVPESVFIVTLLPRILPLFPERVLILAQSGGRCGSGGRLTTGGAGLCSGCFGSGFGCTGCRSGRARKFACCCATGSSSLLRKSEIATGLIVRPVTRSTSSTRGPSFTTTLFTTFVFVMTTVLLIIVVLFTITVVGLTGSRILCSSTKLNAAGAIVTLTSRAAAEAAPAATAPNPHTRRPNANLYPGRRPNRFRHPHPAVTPRQLPPAIMIRRPRPRFIAHPIPPVRRQFPMAVRVRTPPGLHARRSPDTPVITHHHPIAAHGLSGCTKSSSC